MSPIGVDTGGTFTDFISYDNNGRLHVIKVSSTPEDPSQAVLTGLQATGFPIEGNIIHGSTVATNALLQRRGARTALITTAGFADVLAIGRQNRPKIYALVPQKPELLIPEAWRFEVTERVNSRGMVEEPLDLDELASIARQLHQDGIESIAVCLIFSFLNPDHEQIIRDWLRSKLEVGDLAQSPHISISSEILPEYREYERAVATVVNAYVAPLMGHYLLRLSEAVGPRKLFVMQSNGGMLTAGTAGDQAVRTVLSGPAGGIVGALHVALQADTHDGETFDNIITFDMGGTSTDVALCPGQLPVSTESEIAGLPLHLPMIDIHTVGAGGGSLATIDPGGALHVGPQSAGAVPGPACYGDNYPAWRAQMDELFPKGVATVTDANLLLGRIDPGQFLGGHMKLNASAARDALVALAKVMDAKSPEAAALGVLEVANANMERAIRRISVERGHDPRRFTLVAFGGGGPLHACDLATRLNIPRVLIPEAPGVLSALGMIVAAPTRDLSRTEIAQLTSEVELSAEWFRKQFAILLENTMAAMKADGHTEDELRPNYAIDMRYVGQSHELTVPYNPGADSHAMEQAFHEAHKSRYGYGRPGTAVELVTYRVTVSAPARPLPKMTAVMATRPRTVPALTTRTVYFGDGTAVALTYQRETLRPGDILPGPAIIYQYDTTTLVLPEWQAAVDSRHNLVLTAVDLGQK